MMGIDDEIIFEGGDERGRIAKEIAAASSRLDKELEFSFDPSRLESIDLGSGKEDDDDDFAAELQDLETTGQFLRAELNSSDENYHFQQHASQNDEDDDSLKDELQNLEDASNVLHNELSRVTDDSSSDSSFGDMLSENAISEALFRQLHNQQLPLVNQCNKSPSSRVGRPDPPSYAPLEGLEPEEEYGRLSQLPSVEEAKCRPMSYRIDPENPISAAERSAQLSQLGRARALRRSVRKPGQSNRFRNVVMWSCGAVLSGILLILCLVLVHVNDKSRGNQSRLDDVQQFLAANGVSSSVQLTTETSPQFKAARWIADDDRARARISMERDFLDRYVLAVVFFALGGDATWPDSFNFLSASHVCSWNKEVKDESGKRVTMGVHGCQDESNDVPVRLSLAFEGLNGRLPDEIRYLDKLEELVVDHDRPFGGAVPLAISRMAGLKKLSLNHCSFYGKIPDWIGGLTDLTFLALGDNRLSGSIPSSFENLEKLTHLSLERNDLQGDLQVLGSLSNLQYLYLNSNQIEQAELTPLLLKSWPSMVELDLSENFISSRLPEHLFGHSHLEMLDLHGNRLTGALPDVRIEENTSLRFLALYQNELEGTIPKSLSRLGSLNHLDLSQNLLTSFLPTELGAMAHLQSLFVGANPFDEKKFPTFLTQLPSLKELSMDKMNLQGTIPNSLTYLSGLQYLDLSRNELTGSVPDALGALSELSILSLRYNRLTGSLPAALDRLSNLDVLLLERNQLSGTANHFCNTEKFNLTSFGADCGGSLPMISCSCCQICCSDDDSSCN